MRRVPTLSEVRMPNRGEEEDTRHFRSKSSDWGSGRCAFIRRFPDQPT